MTKEGIRRQTLKMLRSLTPEQLAELEQERPELAEVIQALREDPK